jgi:hypothetical protein
MYALIFLLSSTVSIDGYELRKRTQNTKSEKTYGKTLNRIKDQILAMATDVADNGEYRMTFCLPDILYGKHSANEARHDLVTIVGRVAGISAVADADPACLVLDWS